VGLNWFEIIWLIIYSFEGKKCPIEGTGKCIGRGRGGRKGKTRTYREKEQAIQSNAGRGALARLKDTVRNSRCAGRKLEGTPALRGCNDDFVSKVARRAEWRSLVYRYVEKLTTLINYLTYSYSGGIASQALRRGCLHLGEISITRQVVRDQSVDTAVCERFEGHQTVGGVLAGAKAMSVG